MINNNKNSKTNNNDRTNDKRYNIYVVSFSDNVDEEKIEEVLNAKERFEKYGFNVVLGKSLCDNSKENISYDLDKIEKLGKLYKDWILTKEEFEKKKKELLNS